MKNLFVFIFLINISFQSNGQVFLYNTEATELYLGCANRMKILFDNSPNGFLVQGDEAIIFKEDDEWIIAPDLILSPYLTIHLISEATKDTLITYKLKCRKIPTPEFFWGNHVEKNNGFLFDVAFQAFLPSWFPFSYQVEIQNIYFTIHNRRYGVKSNRLTPDLIALLRDLPKGEKVSFDFQYVINQAYFTYQTYWIIN